MNLKALLTQRLRRITPSLVRLLDHNIWGPILNWLAGLWKIAWWILDSIVVASFLSVLLVSLATSGVTGFPDPSHWPLVGLLIVSRKHTLMIGIPSTILTISAFVASWIVEQKRDPNIVIEYLATRIDTINPSRFLDNYISDVYVAREDKVTHENADELARMSMIDISRGAAPLYYGICILGRVGQGKTRMAWEVMQQTFPDWLLVKWPHGPVHPFDYAAYQGERIILWLDDLHYYARDLDGLALLDLSKRFADAGIQVVIVATCRDGSGESSVHERLSGFLEHLVLVRPMDLDQEQARNLVQMLRSRGIETQEQNDGTPGWILLGITKMRNEVYPRLPQDAKRILKTMKLLYLSDIYFYSEKRLSAVAGDLFGLSQGGWREARQILRQDNFIRILDSGALSPMADIYLEQVVSDYPEIGFNVEMDWPELQATFIRESDAEALNTLGVKYIESNIGDRRYRLEEARLCYEAAIDICSRQNLTLQVAGIRNNLGNNLRNQAAMESGPERSQLLELAVLNYRMILQVFSPQTTPSEWAMAQNNLGNAIVAQASMSEGLLRSNLLGQAIQAFRSSIDTRPKNVNPIGWALTQGNLGNALRELATFSEGRDRFTLLELSAAACNFALEVDIRQLSPIHWAGIQNNLANVYSEMVAQAPIEDRQSLYKNAVQAYRSALDVYTRDSNPAEWAMTQVNLANTLLFLSMLMEGDERTTNIDSAIKACESAFEVDSHQLTPGACAKIQNTLGNILTHKASLVTKEERLNLLQAAAEAHQRALTLVTQSDDPTEWAMIQQNLANVLCEQSLLCEGTSRLIKLQQALELCRAVLRVFTRRTAPLHWAMVQNTVGTALRSLAVLVPLTEALGKLKESSQAYQLALEIYTRQNAPIEWAKTQNNLGTTLYDQALLSDEQLSLILLDEAIRAYYLALDVFTRQTAPYEWAMIQNNLGSALRLQATKSEEGSRVALLEDSTSAYQLCLEINTRQLFPESWATTQNNLGNTQFDRAKFEVGSQKIPWLRAAIDAYQKGLVIYSRQIAPLTWADANAKIALVYWQWAMVAPEIEACKLFFQAKLFIEQSIDLEPVELNPQLEEFRRIHHIIVDELSKRSC